MSADGEVRWAATTASVRGASHDRSGLPNQDAVATLAVDGANAGLVGAVADGHGGNRYVRSDVGSRLAVEVACRHGAALMTELGADAGTRAALTNVRSRLAATIVGEWRERVLADFASRPFTTEEVTRAGVPLDAEPLVAYGCTLIVALMASAWVGFLQIGDGDALLVGPDGSVSAPVPGDDRLVGGETTSLCLPDAVADARVTVVGSPVPELVVLCSDGYGNSFASPEWRAESGRDLLDAIHRGGLDEVEAKLPEWLAASAAAGGDDVTMVLARREGPSGAVASPVVVASRPTRSRSAVVVAALVVGLLAGALGGWYLTNRPSESTSRVVSTPETQPSETQPPETAPTVIPVPLVLVTMVATGKIITFYDTETPDQIKPRISNDPSIKPPSADVGVAKVTNGVLTVTIAGGKKSGNVGRQDTVAWQVIGDRVWVAAANGSVRAFGLDAKPRTDWQPAESSGTN